VYKFCKHSQFLSCIFNQIRVTDTCRTVIIL